MRTGKMILGGMEILGGIVFLANSASDIQLGFGAVLVAIGFNQIVNQLGSY